MYHLRWNLKVIGRHEIAKLKQKFWMKQIQEQKIKSSKKLFQGIVPKNLICSLYGPPMRKKRGTKRSVKNDCVKKKTN